MDSGADSTTHCIKSEGRRSSQILRKNNSHIHCSAFLELSAVAHVSKCNNVCLSVFQREPLSLVFSSFLRVRICVVKW